MTEKNVNGIDRIIEIALYLYLFLLFFTKGEGIKNVLLFGSFFLWLGTLRYRKNLYVLKEPVIIFAGLYVASVVTSSLFSIDLRYSLKELKGEPLKFLVLLPMMATVLSVRERLRRAVHVIFFSLLCLVSTGYYSYVTHDFPLMRPYTSILKLWHNKFARYLNTYLPFSFVLFFLWEKKWQKAVLVLAMTISVIALILTTSRGSYLAFFSIVCVWLYCLAGAKGYDLRKMIAGMLVAVAVLGLLAWSSSPFLRQRISSLPQELTTFNQRTQAWAPAIAAFRKRPVFGWGYGDDIFQRDEPYAETTFKAAPPIGPHNTFIRILFHQGLVGLASYLILIAGAMYGCCTALKRSNGLKHKVLIAALSVLVGNYLVHSLFEVLVLNHLAVVLGLVVAARGVREDTDTYKQRSSVLA